ncbi:MAG: hypothetical protein QM788_05380 [Roseateles sp.]|uniref:hypothetical protein n=1 Tax=Roseateles sp. TaxID=1971397 RepID=UPI0039E79C79
MASIEVAQRTMGFKTSSERERCGNCRNREAREYYGRDGLRCAVGGFMVGPYAVCEKYAADRRHEPQEAQG